MTTWTAKVGLRRPTGFGHPLAYVHTVLTQIRSESQAAEPDVKAAAKALDRASQVFGLTVSAPFCVTCTSAVCVCGVGR